MDMKRKGFAPVTMTCANPVCRARFRQPDSAVTSGICPQCRLTNAARFWAAYDKLSDAQRAAWARSMLRESFRGV